MGGEEFMLQRCKIAVQRLDQTFIY